jgi:hypothetical protein
MQALEINDLFAQEGPVGQLFVRLKELGIPVEWEWWINEEGTAYLVDLALPVKDGRLPVTFGDRPGPADGLRFTAEAEPEVCIGKYRPDCVPPEPYWQVEVCAVRPLMSSTSGRCFCDLPQNIDCVMTTIELKLPALLESDAFGGVREAGIYTPIY